MRWKANEKCLLKSSLNKQKQRLKLIHNHFVFEKINFESSKICPFCKMQENEAIGIAQDYFLCCTKSHKQQCNRVETITKEMTTICTPPSVFKVLIESIMHFYEHKPSKYNNPTHVEFNREQDAI